MEERITTYIIATLGIITMMIGWVGIQSIWKKVFAEHVSDVDAMAERTSCGNCGCTTICDTKRQMIAQQEKKK